MDMFYQHITTADVEYRQETIRTDFITSQRVVTVRGVREIIGNAFIQLGSSIHGKARDACHDAAETRDLIRASGCEWKIVHQDINA